MCLTQALSFDLFRSMHLLGVALASLVTALAYFIALTGVAPDLSLTAIGVTVCAGHLTLALAMSAAHARANGTWHSSVVVVRRWLLTAFPAVPAMLVTIISGGSLMSLFAVALSIPLVLFCHGHVGSASHLIDPSNP
jgi:hypothetical protein